MTKDYREILYTVDEAGRRKWVYADIIKGFFYKKRVFVSYGLMAFYLLMPWITVSDKQAILLKISERRFIFFGTEFWATDTQFLFLFFVIMAFCLFFFTALLGRVWCGWLCPETVFLEFLFRPIERLIEGGPEQRKRLDKQAWNFDKIRKKLLKHGLCAFFSWIIASTTLAYFIGREPLLAMMTDWPQNNIEPFIMTLVLMFLMAFQFGWFREQFCTVLCPYARFQSVLMDSNSLIVGYDKVRGEPRGKLKDDSSGDCIDCKLCVRVCPTGIDIRNGLQLECVSCTSCIDACDSIMEKIGRPLGLIRYDTENVLLGKSNVRKILRPRPIIYGALIIIATLSFTYMLQNRELSEFKIIRANSSEPFVLMEDGSINNHFQISVSNKEKEKSRYKFKIVDDIGAELFTPMIPFQVEAGKMARTSLFVKFPKAILKNGKKKVDVKIYNEHDFSAIETVTLVGPGS